MLLAQISDLHVRPQGETYKNAVDSNCMFADAVAHLNRLDPRPDFVLITGDLVDEGQQAEYDNLRALLADLKLPFLLMPGNHDDRELLVRSFPGHDYLPKTGPKHYVIDGHPVYIVAIDTTVPGEHHGLLDEPGVSWLGAALAGSRGAPTVVMMHHPPIACGIPYMDKYMCRQPERIETVIACCAAMFTGRSCSVGPARCCAPAPARRHKSPCSYDLTPSRNRTASHRPAYCIGGTTARWSLTRAISAASKVRFPSPDRLTVRPPDPRSAWSLLGRYRSTAPELSTTSGLVSDPSPLGCRKATQRVSSLGRWRMRHRAVQRNVLTP
jgi:hypothetical protein